MVKTKFIKSEKLITKYSPESAYFLGYLWADGYLNKRDNSIALEIKTEDYLDILNCLNKLGTWNTYTRQRGHWKSITKVWVSDQEAKNFLKENNYAEKDNPKNILEKIPEELRHFWYRGYLDGDGSIYINKECNQLIFSGKYEMNWDFIKSINNNFRIKNIVTKKGHRYSVARLTNRTQIIKLLNWIYQDYNHIGLNRKQNIYQKMKQNEEIYQNNHCS